MAEHLFWQHEKRGQRQTYESNNMQKAIEMDRTAFEEFCDEWSQWAWPNFVHMLSRKLENLAQQREAENQKVPYICKYCGDDWNAIGCEQHVMFQCPFVDGCAMTSFRKYGPGTSTNISVGQHDWANIVHKTASNPYSLMHGVEVQVRLAYFAEVIATYDAAEGGIDWELDSQILEIRDKSLMGSYKRNAEVHQFGVWLGPPPQKWVPPMFLQPTAKASSAQAWSSRASSSKYR